MLSHAIGLKQIDVTNPHSSLYSVGTGHAVADSTDLLRIPVLPSPLCMFPYHAHIMT